MKKAAPFELNEGTARAIAERPYKETLRFLDFWEHLSEPGPETARILLLLDAIALCAPWIGGRLCVNFHPIVGGGDHIGATLIELGLADENGDIWNISRKYLMNAPIGEFVAFLKQHQELHERFDVCWGDNSPYARFKRFLQIAMKRPRRAPAAVEFVPAMTPDQQTRVYSALTQSGVYSHKHLLVTLRGLQRPPAPKAVPQTAPRPTSKQKSA